MAHRFFLSGRQMPYARLPARLRQMIPSEHGQELFRSVFNSQMQSGKPESVAFASAWGALSAAGYKKTNGQWLKKSSPTPSAVHVPSAEWDKAEAYRAPAGARAAAQRAIRWKEKYGDEVKGGTQVGWTRAGQLARGENLSRETVARMASFFARHKGNEVVDPKYKGEPWRDAGHTAWLLWGGDAGASWSRRIMDNFQKRQMDDDTFTFPDEARARSMEMGLGGEIHVQDREGQAAYMPGATHEDYLNALKRLAGIEDDSESVNEGLIERAISAIIGAIMQHTDVNKSFEETKILKVDDEQRIVYGWASVVSEDGEPVVDTQGDVISPVEMEKMANDFMLDVRTAKAMHKGEKIGEVIHSLPLTADLAKALGVHTDLEGWIVGMKIYDDAVWAAVKGGDFGGFSIGGRAASREEME
jgi:cation transport regulator ChaB